MPGMYIRDKPISSPDRMLHKDYESQGAWRQDELIGDKPPVIK
jgi:hypothetical protein